MTYVDNFSHKWYYQLVYKENKKNLFQDISRQSIVDQNKFLIQFVGKNNKDQPEYLFTVFDNYEEFYKYQLNHKIQNRCFFETILGERGQKIYFDVDIEIEDGTIIDHEYVKSDLIKSILLTMQEFGINLNIDRDIIVCTSHSNKKKSYHVIVDNYKIPDCRYNAMICKLVMQKMQLENCKYIDNDIYTSIRQFRLLGSQKKDSGRVKIFNEKWLFYKDEISYEYPETLNADKYLYQFSRTVINNVSYCKPLQFIDLNKIVLQNSKLTANINRTRKDGIEVTDEIAHLALKKLADYAQISINNPLFPYKVRGIANGYICLKRLRPSMCKICSTETEKVVHEKEGPYMSISSKGDIYFDCRRSTNHGEGIHKTLLIGNIGSDVISQVIITSTKEELIDDGENIEYEEIVFDKKEVPNLIVPEVVAPLNIPNPVEDILQIDPKVLERKQRAIKAAEGAKKQRESINYKHEFSLISSIEKTAQRYKGKK